MLILFIVDIKKHLDGTETNISGTYKLMKQSSDEAIKCLIEGRYFTGGTWNKIFSKSCLEGISFETDLKINEDILFTFCAFQKARNILFYDAPFIPIMKEKDRHVLRQQI